MGQTQEALRVFPAPPAFFGREVSGAGVAGVSSHHSEETHSRGSAYRKRWDVGQLHQRQLPKGSVLSLCLPRPEHNWPSLLRGPLGRWTIPMAARRSWEWKLAYQPIQVIRIRADVW